MNKFLIIGNYNNLIRTMVFNRMRNNQMWLGMSKRGMDFVMQDGTFSNINACWFTNMENDRRNGFIPLKPYDETRYQRFDNYSAINVNKTKDIPDYDGVMGVPITFLERYNPDQFEILDITQREMTEYRTRVYGDEYDNWNDLNASGVIMVDGIPKLVFARILIRRKKNELI